MFIDLKIVRKHSIQLRNSQLQSQNEYPLITSFQWVLFSCQVVIESNYFYA